MHADSIFHRRYFVPDRTALMDRSDSLLKEETSELVAMSPTAAVGRKAARNRTRRGQVSYTELHNTDTHTDTHTHRHTHNHTCAAL